MRDGREIPLTAHANSRRETLRIGELVQGNLEQMPFDVKEYLEVELPAKVDPDCGN